MTVLSPSRVLKRPDAAGSHLIEQYIPPTENTISSHAVQKAASFPHYDRDGRQTGEFHLTAGEASVEETPEGVAVERAPNQEELLKREWEEKASRMLEEARQQAEDILEAAREQIREELATAREEGLREGREAGYAEGRANAQIECRQEFEDSLAAFRTDIKNALQSVETAKENCIRDYLDELKDCAVAVAEKVVHVSLKSSGEVIKQMIISATEKLKKTAWVKIYIDKYDYDMMMEADADVIDELSRLSDNVKFIVMDKETSGSCIIEMPEEIVDVSVNTQLENIKDILENVRL